VLCCVFARALPLCVLLVRLSRGLLGWWVALSLGLSLAPGLALGLAPGAAPASWPAVLVALLRELCLGGLVALSLLLPVAAAGWAARFSEQAVGPWRGRPSGPIAAIYGLAAGFLCLELGLHRLLVIGLHESLLVAPPAVGAGLGLPFALGVVRLVATAVALAVALGLPLLACALLLEAGRELLGRLLGPASRAILWPSLTRPLLVLLAAGLLMPTISELPAALRVGLRLLRELTRRATSP
jgi:hypothetical protein